MKKTLGMMIAELRKEKGMTQLELAENPKQSPKEIVQIVLKAVPFAMGVAMGNASMDLKAVADDICGDVAEDGIYHYCMQKGLI